MAAIRKGFLLMMPMILIGSISTLIINLPIHSYQSFMLSVFGNKWQAIGQAIYNGSFGIFSILATVTISYSLSQSHPLIKDSALSPLMTSFTSLLCLFVIYNPYKIGAADADIIGYLGVIGVFFAIIISVTSTEIFLVFSNIKKLNIRIYNDEAEPIISQALNSIIPAVLTAIVFIIIKIIFIAVGIENIHASFYLMISKLFSNMDYSLSSALLFIFTIQVFWFLGIHGNNVMEPITRALYAPVILSNVNNVGINASQLQIFTKPFFDSFVFIGGSGATFCLIIAILLTSKRNNLRRLSKISLAFSIFNINEIIIFGIPIVLNPYYLIPFIAVPLYMTASSYFFTKIGVLPITLHNVNWTTPPLLSGYIATGSIRGSLVQLFNIAIGSIMYFPFVKSADKQKELEMKTTYNHLVSQVLGGTLRTDILSDPSSMGNLSRILANDLKKALGSQDLYMVYQPQVDTSGKAFGMEALLRWEHEIYGNIPSPLIITIAEEANFINQLGKWIIHESITELSELKRFGKTDIIMSINLSVKQLYNPLLYEEVMSEIKENRLSPDSIELEITEGIALIKDAVTEKVLTKFHKSGIRLAMDDFGMGHSSLLYIREFSINTVKIDGSLTKDVLINKESQKIIASIASLCNTLGIGVIVEYVETLAQVNMLESLGCTKYQGYFFSSPLTKDKISCFIEGNSIGGQI